MSAARLAHRLEGPEGAPVVVLSSSLGTTAAMWDGVAPALAERFRVLRYDHRGHGGSEVPPGEYSLDDLGGDVLALLDELGIERASFCGVSLGGMVGLWLALEAPQRIDRLALLCTAARIGPPQAWAERIAAVRAGQEAIADAVVGRWFTPGFAAREPEAVARCRAELVASPNAGYAGCCAAIRDLDLRDRLDAVAAPTLVLGALGDESTPVALQAELAARIPGARLEILADAAHLAPVEHPTPVARLLLDHLTTPRAGSRASEGYLDPLSARDAEEDGDGGRYARGMAVRREVLGDAHVDAAVAATDDFDADFQRYIAGAAWADVWGRGTIDRRTRSAIVLTAVLAANRMDEFAMHVRAARRNGLSAEEIAEVILTAAVYVGVPAANEGFRVARRALSEEP